MPPALKKMLNRTKNHRSNKFYLEYASMISHFHLFATQGNTNDSSFF